MTTMDLHEINPDQMAIQQINFTWNNKGWEHNNLFYFRTDEGSYFNFLNRCCENEVLW